MVWILCIVCFIIQFEGFSPTPYNFDGVPTIGYGFTNTKKTHMTRAEADKLLENKIDYYRKIIHREVTVPLNKTQEDALISLTYNIGAGAFSRSSLLKELNSGNYFIAPKFLEWVYDDGEKLRGLVKRRKAEATLWVLGTWDFYSGRKI